MSRRRIFVVSEARCQSEDCAKLHTRKIVENRPHFWEFILAAGAAIQACRRHPRGPSTPGPPPSRKVTSRIDATAAIAVNTAQFQAGTTLRYIALIFKRYL
jgi:hypothetical protein